MSKRVLFLGVHIARGDGMVNDLVVYFFTNQSKSRGEKVFCVGYWNADLLLVSSSDPFVSYPRRSDCHRDRRIS